MKKLYCYSKWMFDLVMTNLGYKTSEDLPKNIAVISIGAIWNEKETHFFKAPAENILNMDFDDIVPFWWKEDYYDVAQSDENQAKYFDYDYEKMNGKTVHLHVLDYKEAKTIVDFIEAHKDCDLYIHCHAGVSRSQAIVRFILDTYGEDNFETNPDNSCLYPNRHVVLMLKRVYRQFYMSY